MLFLLSSQARALGHPLTRIPYHCTSPNKTYQFNSFSTIRVFIQYFVYNTRKHHIKDYIWIEYYPRAKCISTASLI